MPYQKLQDLLAEPDDTEYQRKTTKLIIGKKEYRISNGF